MYLSASYQPLHPSVILLQLRCKLQLVLHVKCASILNVTCFHKKVPVLMYSVPCLYPGQGYSLLFKQIRFMISKQKCWQKEPKISIAALYCLSKFLFPLHWLAVTFPLRCTNKSNAILLCARYNIAAIKLSNAFYRPHKPLEWLPAV